MDSPHAIDPGPPRLRWLQARLLADPRANQLDPEDRKVMFRDYVQELEDKEIAAKNAEREAKRALERAKKDDLKAVLNTMVEKGEVSGAIRWLCGGALVGLPAHASRVLAGSMRRLRLACRFQRGHARRGAH